MTDSKLQDVTTRGLLSLYGRVLEELRRREIIRSYNNPVADYSELLFCAAFKWHRVENSNAGYDATEGSIKYQIKGRRVTSYNPSRQLSAIRKIDDKPFDILAGVIFNEDFGVHKAALVPINIVQIRSRRSDHVNAALFNLEDVVWTLPGVTDVTEQLLSIQASDT